MRQFNGPLVCPPRFEFNRLCSVHRRGSATKGCLISALIVFVLLLVASGIGAYVVFKNGRSWMGAGFETGMVAAVDQLSMPESERDEVKLILKQVRTDFVDKKINFKDFGLIVKELQESPLLPATIASESYQQYYAHNEELGIEEKAAAELQLSRVSRGVFEKTMTMGNLVDVLEPINAESGSTRTGVAFQMNGVNIKLKMVKDCTAEELRQVISNAQAKADEAGVPDEAFTIDISDEFQRVIDKARSRAEGASAAPETDEAGATSVEDAADTVETITPIDDASNGVIDRGADPAVSDDGP